MRILVKSAPKTNNFLAKVKNKTNLIEVQIISWFTDEQMVKDSMRQDIDIINVHTPLLENGEGQLTDGVNLDEFRSPFTYKVLVDTCIYAEKLAEYYNHDIRVIVHNGWSIADWQKSGQIDNLAKMFKGIIENYPHLNFAIENITPIGRHGFKTGCWPEDAAYVAAELNKKLKTKKFTTVIDICHLLMTNYVIEQSVKSSTRIHTRTIDELFKQSNGLCSVIHLNNKIGDGMEGNHGTPFTNSEEDKALLTEILTAYAKYTPNADIVIEVKEDDYLNCVNCYETIETLQNVNKLLKTPNNIILNK